MAPEAGGNDQGVSLASKGHYDQGIGYFRCALYCSESYLPAYKNLLAAYVETKQWPEAMKAGETAERLHPLFVELQRDSLPDDAKTVKQLHEDRGFIANLGRAYLETGDLSKARNRYMLFLGLAPNELEGYSGLGETAFRQGDYGKALRLLGQSLKLYGDQPKIAARIGEIAKKSDDLAGKAQWVLANYVQRGGKPGTASAPGMPGGAIPQPPQPNPAAQFPQVPTPGPAVPTPQIPVPQPQTPFGSE